MSKKTDQELIAEVVQHFIAELDLLKEANFLIRGRNSGGTVLNLYGLQDPEGHAARKVWKAARKMSPNKIAELKSAVGVRLKGAARELASADRDWKEREAHLTSAFGKDWFNDVRTPDEAHTTHTELARRHHAAARKFHTLRAIHSGLEKAHNELQPEAAVTEAKLFSGSQDLAEGKHFPSSGDFQSDTKTLKEGIGYSNEPKEDEIWTHKAHGNRTLVMRGTKAGGMIGHVDRIPNVNLSNMSTNPEEDSFHAYGLKYRRGKHGIIHGVTRRLGEFKSQDDALAAIKKFHKIKEGAGSNNLKEDANLSGLKEAVKKGADEIRRGELSKKRIKDIIAEARASLESKNGESIDEAIIKQFPKSRRDHQEKKRNTELYNLYHKTLAHAKTLSDRDLAARVKRHEDERHVEWHDENPARNNPDGNIPNIENAHYKLQAYAYEHRLRTGKPHPALDSFTPEYVDQQLKDRY